MGERGEDTTDAELLREVCETLAGELHEAFWLVEVSEAGRRVLFMSPAFAEIWGRPVDEVSDGRVRRGDPLGVHPDDARRVLAAMENAREQLANEVEYRVVRPDGSIRNVRTRHVLISPPGTEPARVLGVSTDITAELELELQRRRFQDQLNAVPEPTYTLRVEWRGASREDFELVLIGYNRAADELVGGRMAGMLGTRAGEFFRDRPAVLHALEECVRTRRPVHVDTPHRRVLDGEEMYLSLTCTFLEPDIVQAHARDLRAFRKALAAAGESAEPLRALLTQLSDSVAILRADGQVAYGNPALAKSLGYSREHPLPANVFDLVHPEDRGRAHDSLERARTAPDGRAETYLRIRHANGDWRDVHLLATNLLEDPGVQGLVINVFDITDRLRAERALRETAGRFRSILEATSDLITLVDRAGRIGYQSPSSERMLGFVPQELLGHPAAMLVHPDDRARFQGSFECMLRQPGETIQGEPLRLRGRDGRVVTIEYTGRNLLDDPGVSAVLLTGHDVSERMRAAEELRQSQEQLRFSQRMEAVGRLAGGIAHDFNNILTVVQGHLDLLLSDPPNSRQELAAQLEEVRAAAERATRLTRQLLAFSRQQVLRSEPLTIDEVLTGLEPLLRRALSERIDVHYELGSDGATVLADRGQLEQVVLNLALNARDAMPHAGGLLTLRTSVMNVAHPHALGTPFEVAPGWYVALEVEDTGIGIAPDVLPNIFEPFFTTKEQGRGTGLGLSTVYGIVKQSGGFIWARSATGLGTRFTVLLPRIEGEAPRPPEPGERAGAAESAPGTVLVVEDDDSVRGLVERFLRADRMRVVAVPSAAAALELLEAGQQVDVVLTDIVMPRMSGLELTRRIRARWPELPIVLMSGYTEEYPLGEGGLPENTIFLEKPFTKQELLAAVHAARR